MQDGAARNSKSMMTAEKFRNDILSGIYPCGSRLPSDEMIARDYGINKRTVAAGMAQLVAEGLITRAPGRGSVVVREEVVSKHTNVIDCIARGSGAIYENMEAEITLQSMKRGFHPVWIPPSLIGAGPFADSYRMFLQYMENAINAMPHGMVVYGERFIPYEMLERNLAKIGRLVFICNYAYSKELTAKYVLIDYDAAAKKAVALFRKNGHKKITLIASPVNTIRKIRGKPPQSFYHLALKKACSEAGVEYDEKVPQMCWDSRQEEAFRRIREKGITAAALGFDSLSWIYSGLFRKAGIRIPEDLSVIGFYDTAGPESGLTSLNIQERVIATTAAEMLFEDKSEIRKVYVKPELIERESVRALCNIKQKQRKEGSLK